MKKYYQIFWGTDGKLLKKTKYGKTWQINLREWQKWQQLFILYISIVTLWCYSYKSWIYSNNYQSLNSAGNGYNCIHMYAYMLTFCVTAIYYIINSAYAFFKSTNMIYQNCVYQGAVYNINQICQGLILIRVPSADLLYWNVWSKLECVKFTLLYFARARTCAHAHTDNHQDTLLSPYTWLLTLYFQ